MVPRVEHKKTYIPWVYVALIGALFLVYVLSAHAQTIIPFTSQSPEGQSCVDLAPGQGYSITATTSAELINPALIINLWYAPKGTGASWGDNLKEAPYLMVQRKVAGGGWVRQTAGMIKDYSTFGTQHHEIDYVGQYGSVASSVAWNITVTARSPNASMHTLVCMLLTMLNDVTGVHGYTGANDDYGQSTTLPFPSVSSGAPVMLFGAYQTGVPGQDYGVFNTAGNNDGQVPSWWYSGINSGTVGTSLGVFDSCSASSVRPHLVQRFYGPSDTTPTSVTAKTLTGEVADACLTLQAVIFTNDPNAVGPFWNTPGTLDGSHITIYTNDLAGRVEKFWDTLTTFFPFNWWLQPAGHLISWTASSTPDVVIPFVVRDQQGNQVFDASFNFNAITDTLGNSTAFRMVRKGMTYLEWIAFALMLFMIAKPRR